MARSKAECAKKIVLTLQPELADYFGTMCDKLIHSFIASELMNDNDGDFQSLIDRMVEDILWDEGGETSQYIMHETTCVSDYSPELSQKLLAEGITKDELIRHGFLQNMDDDLVLNLSEVLLAKSDYRESAIAR